MPHRSFSVEEAARYLHVDAARVEEWVRRREIPFERQAGRSVFRRGDLDTWASQRILSLEGERLADYHRGASTRARHSAGGGRDPRVGDLLAAGACVPALTSRSKAGVLRELVAAADRAGVLFDARDLLTSLEARESLCSTGIPGGLALLHPRHHDPYLAAESFLIVARAVHPLPFGAPDGRTTDLFFLLCCLDDRLHLHALARLCTLCQTTDLLARLRAATDAEAMVTSVHDCEAAVVRKLEASRGGPP